MQHPMQRRRIALGLTQEQVAEAVGCKAASTISRWEHCVTVPSVQWLRKLATVLHCEVTDLLVSAADEAVMQQQPHPRPRHGPHRVMRRPSPTDPPAVTRAHSRTIRTQRQQRYPQSHALRAQSTALLQRSRCVRDRLTRRPPHRDA